MKKTMVIIGMGGGISYATALHFGHEDFNIIMISRNQEKLKAYKEMLDNDGIDSAYRVADAGNESELSEALESIKSSQNGIIDVLFYNAAVLRQKHILEESMEQMIADFKVNVGGAITAVKAVIEPMRKNNAGTILFTGGGLALHPLPVYGSLSIGKSAILSLSRQISAELKDTKVKVGTVVVRGYVTADHMKYNPSSIAEKFWQIHHQSEKELSEIIY